MAQTRSDDKVYPVGEHPVLLPPPGQTGMLAWLRKNLFSSFANSMLTLLLVALLLYALIPLLHWAVIDAAWGGSDPQFCENRDGACWTFIRVRMNGFLYGNYPRQEYWRINLCFLLFFGLLGYLIIARSGAKKWVGIFTLTGLPVIAFILLHGGILGLRVVETSAWGGFSLTVVIAFTGIVASLPVGILLALGRRSDMAFVRAVCVIFIEFWRGVPLITVMFMASVMLPFFMPEGVNFDKLVRVLIAVTLFSAAYMAEVIRGGLQAIPKGQVEAAQSLGLSYWKMMGFVVLPQALKLVIPGIVNNFISLFKDTSLVLIVGLFDFLGAIKSALSDAKWLAYSVEGYVFAALVYFICCFAMSRYSMYLENKLHTGHRR